MVEHATKHFHVSESRSLMPSPLETLIAKWRELASELKRANGWTALAKAWALTKCADDLAALMQTWADEREALSDDAMVWYRQAQQRSEEGSQWRLRAERAEALLSSLVPPPETPAGDSLIFELLAALKQVKKIPRPWIDGAIKRGDKKHVPMLTFAEWDAACEQIDQAIAKAEAVLKGAPETQEPRAEQPTEETRVEHLQYPSNPLATAASNESNPAFFRTLTAWHRHDDPDGGEIIEVQFAEGGRVNVLTDKPLIFIEPERH
jgi:hypothetical protein